MKFNIHQPLSISELGNRDGQEDSIFPPIDTATLESRLFVVCDGMGGHQHGEVASRIVAETLGNALNNIVNTVVSASDIENAINQAYDYLDEAYLQSNESEGNKMGTTLTILCLHKGGCMIGHIGDSRIYHIRPASKEIVNRTRDHSLVQQLFDVGEITEEEMRTSSKKNVILKAMQPNQQCRTMPELVNITDIRPDDYFYMCTDGMLENMDDKELLSIITNDTLNDREKVGILKSRTQSNADNHSAYLIHIEDVIKDIVAPVVNKDGDIDTDVLLVDDGVSVAPSAIIDNSVESTIVKPTNEHTHKVVVIQKKTNNNSILRIIIIAVIIALVGFFTYWILDKGKKPETEHQFIRQEQPRKTGDDYLNEHSKRRGTTTTRKVETTNSAADATESRVSIQTNDPIPNVDQPSQSAAHQNSASVGQQIQDATSSNPNAKRNAVQTIREAGHIDNGFSLGASTNIPTLQSDPVHDVEDDR